MSEKPIIFNTEMVKAILEGRKTVTRQIIKVNGDKEIENAWLDRDRKSYFQLSDEEKQSQNISIVYKNGSGIIYKGAVTPPYIIGDTMWVRETWNIDKYKKPKKAISIDFQEQQYRYRADSMARSDGKPLGWKPSIHMPRSAARIFLKVTDVKVEHLQDITESQAFNEGCETCIGLSVCGGGCDSCPSHRPIDWFRELWDGIYSKPHPVKKNGVITHYESYPWEDIQERKTYKGIPWIVRGNPWVLVTEFKKLEG